MPMIDLYAPAGVLRADELTVLAGRVIAAVQREEGFPPGGAADRVSWIYVHEVPAGRILMGRGARLGELWRVEIASPAGALSDAAKARLGPAIERLVAAADGSPAAGRVWLLFRDVREGDWVAGAYVASLEGVRRMVLV